MQSSLHSEHDVDVTELVEAVDIVEFIAQYCDLEERRDGEFWGLSPLKDEKTPSFSVNRDLQCFYDFSSGKGGNVISFIRAYHKCGFTAALNILRDYLGPDGGGTHKSRRKLNAVKVLRRFCPKQRAEKHSAATVLPSDYMALYDIRPDKLKLWQD